MYALGSTTWDALSIRPAITGTFNEVHLAHHRVLE